MLENYKVAALIGTIVFLLSGVLPLVSISLFDFSFYFSLLSVYNLVLQGGSSSSASFTVTAGSVGFLLMMILYPVALILGMVSIFKRKVAVAAGILGLICWAGAAVALNDLQVMSYAGLALYVGFLGAIILLIASGLKPSMTAPQAPPPPPAPQ
jgi:hypothetical protein